MVLFFFTSSHCKRQGLLYRKSTVYSIDRSLIVDPTAPNPFNETFCFSVDCEYKISPSILSLFSACCPSAIFRTVISIIVDSIYGKTVRFFSHVLKKIHVFTPSFANRYTTTSVIGIIFTLWIIATIPHGQPYMVLFCVSVAVLYISRRLFLPHQASATFSDSLSDAIKRDFLFISAFTFTPNARTVIFN